MMKVLFLHHHHHYHYHHYHSKYYKSPSINKNGLIYPEQGGILMITGDDFYGPIDRVIIGDTLNCNDPKFINHTVISCFIPANNTSNIKYDEMMFINVTTYGKSGGSKVFKFCCC
ncbi:hypothetical protein ACTFIU_000892 [Dictyostelium citrinum]